MLQSHATGGVPRRPALVQRQPQEEVGNQFYAHGGFMGAAPQMVRDPAWMKILKVLMPDVYDDVQGVTDMAALIPMFENNPVMAAYGMLATQQLDRQGQEEGGRSDRIDTIQAFEWDVFLDQDLVRAYSVAFTESAERALDVALVDRMLIAHAGAKDTFDENVLGANQYDDVSETAKTEMGGTHATGWMDLFGRALTLATADNPDELIQQMSGEPRRGETDNEALRQTFEHQMRFQDVVDLYKRVFGKDTFSVILDVKSRNALPHILAKVVRELNRRGVHVYGIGTFEFSELDNLDELTQSVGGQELPPPTGVKFFHGIGNLQTACADGDVNIGDSVMFNAGSILDSVDWDADKPDADDAAIEAIIQDLAAFKRTWGFHLGLYVQEGDTDGRAAAKITAFSNRHADIFDMGFSWGGLSTEMGPVDSGGSGMGSQAIIPWNEHDDDVDPGSTRFTSSFAIRRFVESRHFEVRRGYVEVAANASWSFEPAGRASYSITLRQSDWFTDSTYDAFWFSADEQATARWRGLDDGTYYLELDIEDQEQATLEGDVEVKT